MLICMTILSTADNQKPQIVLRAKAYHAPPFMVLQKDDDGNVKIKGAVPEHLNLLAHALGDARIEYSFFNQSHIRKYGLLEANIQAVIDNETDITSIYVTPFLKGVESVYMAYAAATYEENILMIAYPKEADGGLFAVLTPFSYQVWLSMLICGAVHELARLAITYLEKKMPVDSETIRYWRSIRFQFILNGTRVLMVAILSMAYASTVVSFLTVRKLNHIPNTIEDLANYPDMDLLAFRGHPIISAAQVGCILIRCVWYFLRFPPTI